MRTFAILTGIAGAFLSLPGLTSSAEGDGRVALEERILKGAGVETSGEALLDFFRQRALSEERLKKVPELIRLLADPSFPVREEATKELIGMGRAALPALEEAAKGPDPEVRYRAGRSLVTIAARTDTEVTLAALRVLADRNPPEAVETLLAFLPSAGDPAVEEEAATALATIGVRDGTPHAALVEAARSDQSLHRLIAASALARSAGAEHRALARKLLEDAEPRVRWQAARALLAAHDKSAVPALVELVGEGPMPLARLADDLLFRIAGDKAPPVGLGQGDADSRRQCRTAWAGWWRANQANVDLAKLNWKVELDPDLSRLIDHSVQTIREVLTGGKADQRLYYKAQLAATMIAFYAQSGPGGAATPLRATLRDAALVLAKSIQDKRYDDALKQVRDLPNLNPDRRARIGTVPIIGSHVEFDQVMYYFANRVSGFEMKLIKLQEVKTKKLAPAALSDELLVIAAHAGVIAEVIRDFEHDLNKKKMKDWQKKADELRLAAREFSTAVKARQEVEGYKSLTRLNNACMACHEAYR